MPTPRDRAERRSRHRIEIEASQASLRKNIIETERLLSESEIMIKRHRKECEDAGSGDMTRD